MMAANQKRKTAPRKRTAVRKNSSKQKRTTSAKKEAFYRDEIILVVTLAVSILLVLGNFHLSGKAGEAVNSFTFGVFGFMAYLLPYLLFLGTAFYISNRGNKEAVRKAVSSVLLFFIVCALLQMLTGTYNAEKKLAEYYFDSYHGKNGGGIAGGALCSFLCPLFGTIGTYVVLLALSAVLVMFITEKLLFASLRKKRKIRRERRAFREETEEDYELDLESRKRIKPITILKEDDGKKEPQVQAEKISKKGRKRKNVPVEMQEILPENAAALEEVPEPIPEIPIINSFRGEPEKPVLENQDKPQHVDMEKAETSDMEEIQKKIESVQKPDELAKKYKFPPISLLSKPKANKNGISDRDLKETAMKLKSTLDSFGVRVTVTNISCGPAVTRYELQPEQGVKVSRITNLSDDIKLNLAAADIRIEAPIPGKAAVGIEVPNKENTAVMLRELLETPEFKKHPSKIAFAVGKDIGGKTVVTDIGKMPHLLIAGATGSGKSVCINTLIMSILYKADPADVKLIMVDPKVVELSVYNGIPHLLIPVVTDPKKASAALNWAVMEMTERYSKFAELGVRDIRGYNEKVKSVEKEDDGRFQKMPQIVIIVDELADLMMVAPGEVEDAICRLAQMARAAGLHLIIATQRPSVNVITGLIKANVPSRIAFSVSSAIDSRTIIDGAGAEKLLGKGDMLFFPSGYAKPVRVQGAFVSDKEVSAVVEFLSSQTEKENVYDAEIENKIASVQSVGTDKSAAGNDRDEYFMEAGKCIIEKDKASIGMLQRVYKIGFNRAARIMDQLYEAGVVGPEEGTKPRKVIMSMEEFESFIEENV